MDDVRTGGHSLILLKDGGLSENLADEPDDDDDDLVVVVVMVMKMMMVVMVMKILMVIMVMKVLMVMVMMMWTTAGKSSKAVVLMVLIRAPATRKTSTNFPTVDAKAVIDIDDLNN